MIKSLILVLLVVGFSVPVYAGKADEIISAACVKTRIQVVKFEIKRFVSPLYEMPDGELSKTVITTINKDVEGIFEIIKKRSDWSTDLSWWSKRYNLIKNLKDVDQRPIRFTFECRRIYEELANISVSNSKGKE